MSEQLRKAKLTFTQKFVADVEFISLSTLHKMIAARVKGFNSSGLPHTVETECAIRFAPTETNYVVGLYHACIPSPIGRCEYDPHEDPTFDDCVHCGEPEERN